MSACSAEVSRNAFNPVQHQDRTCILEGPAVDACFLLFRLVAIASAPDPSEHVSGRMARGGGCVSKAHKNKASHFRNRVGEGGGGGSRGCAEACVDGHRCIAGYTTCSVALLLCLFPPILFICGVHGRNKTRGTWRMRKPQADRWTHTHRHTGTQAYA